MSGEGDAQLYMTSARDSRFGGYARPFREFHSTDIPRRKDGDKQ